MDIPKIKGWLWDHKIKLAVGVSLIGLSVWGYNTVRDLRKKNSALTAENSTLLSNFQRIDGAYQSKALELKSEKLASDAASKAFSSKLVNEMEKSKAKIRALYEVNGELQSQLNNITPVVVKPTATGGFSGVTLVEVRKGPPLAEVTLNYDPTVKTKGGQLTGHWLAYKEDYYTTLGDWEKQDKGFVSTVKMEREISKPDGKGGFIVVGREEIPLVSSTASYSPAAFGGSQALDPVPRLGIWLGPGWDTSNHRVVPALGVDYRITTHIGLGAGIVGNTELLTLSYRLGK